MLYAKCPTCKTILANKQVLYEEGMEKICSNTKMSNEDKKKAKNKLLTDLAITNICCRMRTMSYVKKVELIM